MGPKDLKQGQCVAVRRDTGEKITLPEADTEKRLIQLLEDIQANLFKRYAYADPHTHLLEEIKANLLVTPTIPLILSLSRSLSYCTGANVHAHAHTHLLNSVTNMPPLPLCCRASDDLNKHMVVADSMEQFQKDLDQGRVCYVEVCFC